MHLKNKKMSEGELYRETKFGNKNENVNKDGKDREPNLKYSLIEKQSDKEEEEEKVENIKDRRMQQSDNFKGKKKISGNVTNLEQQQQQQQHQGEVEDVMDVGGRKAGENHVAKNWGKEGKKDISTKNILNANSTEETSVIVKRAEREGEKFRETIETFQKLETTTSKLSSPVSIKTTSTFQKPSGAGKTTTTTKEEDYGVGKNDKRTLFPPQFLRNQTDVVASESDCILGHSPDIACNVKGEVGKSSGVQEQEKEEVGVQPKHTGGCSESRWAKSAHQGELKSAHTTTSSTKTAAVHDDGCTCVHCSSFTASSASNGTTRFMSVVHEQQEGSEVSKSFRQHSIPVETRNNKNNGIENSKSEKKEEEEKALSTLSLRFCKCENWPRASRVSSQGDVVVDVDEALGLPPFSSSPELCVECGRQVAATQLEEVLLSVLRDREAFHGRGCGLLPPAATPPDVPPSPPSVPHFELEENGDVPSEPAWSEDLYLSREVPLSVDSPPSGSCDSDSPTSLASSSDLSTVICVDDFTESVFLLEKSEQQQQPVIVITADTDHEDNANENPNQGM